MELDPQVGLKIPFCTVAAVDWRSRLSQEGCFVRDWAWACTNTFGILNESLVWSLGVLSLVQNYAIRLICLAVSGLYSTVLHKSGRLVASSCVLPPQRPKQTAFLVRQVFCRSPVFALPRLDTASIETAYYLTTCGQSRGSSKGFKVCGFDLKGIRRRRRRVPHVLYVVLSTFSVH